MNFIKSVVPNLIFYTGYFILIFGSLFTAVGIFLHKKLKTESGKRLIKAEENARIMREKFKELNIMAKFNKDKAFYVDGDGGNA
jgi:hypothetical protein